MKRYWLLFFLLSLLSLPAAAQWSNSKLSKCQIYMWDTCRMRIAKESQETIYMNARQALLREADKLLNESPATVIDQERVAPSKNKHDYFSMARYWWRNPDTPDGLPYIRRDGEVNPETKNLGRTQLSRFEKQITILTLAYYYSGKEAYAEQAWTVLRTWFINKKTYMSPHMQYSQVRMGHNNNQGSNSGLLDGYSFLCIPDALSILSNSPSANHKDAEAIRQWFAQYLEWMTTSEQGKEEDHAANNHGTAYHIQVALCASFVGNDTLRQQYIRSFAQKRILPQFELDGRQPKELVRTRAFGYSCYNLKHIFDFADICERQGVHLFDDAQVRERIIAAIDYLTPYLGRPVTAWPYQQIADWEKEQQNLCWILYRADAYFPEKGYKVLFQKHNKAKPSDKHYLL